jgi:hypothetical protein
MTNLGVYYDYCEMNGTMIQYRNRIFSAGLIAITTLLVLGACRKDEPLPPDVEFILPAENAWVTAGDTVVIKARIKSSRAIRAVEIKLLSPTGTVAGQVFGVHPGDKEYLLEVEYPLDKELASGNHQFLLLAEDGEGQKWKYRTVRVIEIPRKLEGYVALVQQSAGSRQLIDLSTDLQIRRTTTFPGDHLTSVVTDNGHILVTAGRVFGPLTAFDLKEWKTLWQVPTVPNPPESYFTALSTAGNRILVGYQAGYVRSYHISGNTEATVSLYVSNREPRFVSLVNDILAIDEASRFGPECFLNMLFYPSGSLSGSLFPGMHTLALIPRGVSSFVWIGNLDSQGQLRFVGQGNGGNWSWSPGKVTPTGIRAVTSYTASDIFLATWDGILLYVPFKSSLDPFRSDINAQHLSFDLLNRRLLASEGKRLYVLDYPTGQEIGSVMLNDSILECWPWYNK